jgi:hypothetical protein
MNRKQRRQAARAKTVQPIKRKAIQKPNLADIQGVFGHIDVMFDQLKRTHQVNTVRGVPVMSDWQGDTHVIHSAILGWCDLWKKLSERFNFIVDLTPLVVMANRLECGVPLYLELVESAHRAIDRCRAIYAHLDVFAVADMVRQQCQDYEIRDLLAEKLKADAKTNTCNNV